VSPGFDGNNTFAIGSVFSSNIQNWTPDVDVRIRGNALVCGWELLDFHTIPGSLACRNHSQQLRLAFCIGRSHRFLTSLNSSLDSGVVLLALASTSCSPSSSEVHHEDRCRSGIVLSLVSFLSCSVVQRLVLSRLLLVFP
jgi:hypothetical protein